LAAVVAAAPTARAEPPAYILVDADRDAVLADQGADQLWYPASLSKLMTAYVTFSAMQAGRLKPTSPVTISKNALDQPPAKMGFKVGTVMTLDNALKMLMVKSANDIAVAVAETVGGRESVFVRTMNDTAARLGMASTHYNNPHGLPDPGQVTTARDLAVLAEAIWTDFPEYRQYLGIAAIKSGKKVLPSGNQLLERYRGTNGMKTGFICSSGYNLIASATRDGRTLIAVVLGGSSSRETAERSAGLLNQGFSPPLLTPTATGRDLRSFAATAAEGPPVDMREHGICRAGPDDNEEGAAAAAPEPTVSALEPRFVLMAPVVVTTGIPKTAPASAAKPQPPPPPAAAKAPPAKVIPLPRLRPSTTPETVQQALAAFVN
jgi:D-alanyl-D-alanine carboxypeptidase